MTRKAIISLLGMALLASCVRFDPDDFPKPTEDDANAVKEHAESLFGTIDPAQDWNSIVSGTITIKADADLQNIVKVQVLTESPFLNTYAKVLNETEATNGQEVTLVYDAPNVYSRLIAACVSKDGIYRIKGFDLSDTQVSFASTAQARMMTRAAGDYNFPDVNNMTLPLAKSFISYNAMRAMRATEGVTDAMSGTQISLWKGSGWQNDRYWRVNSDNRSSQPNYKITFSGSDWYVQNYSLRHDIDNITAEETAELQDIFNNYLYWNESTARQRNNLDAIRNSDMVKLYNNQFEATGQPLILTPVQTTSSDIGNCDLYYYYYNPADVAGMTEAQEVQYIKNLPKFMAIAPWDLMDKNASGNPVGSATFFKKAEYVLPYYGDAPSIVTTTPDGYTTDGKVYRIRNGYELDNERYYMVYHNNEKSRLATAYAEDNIHLPFQMWQIFSKQEGNNTYYYLYNIGAHCFLDVVGDWSTGWTKNDILVKTNNKTTTTCRYQVLQSKNEGAIKLQPDNSGFSKNEQLGTDLGRGDNNKGIWSNKNGSDGRCDWYLDEYTGSWDFSQSKLTSLKLFTGDPDKAITAKSYSIPKGYKVGFLLRKAKKNHDDAYNYYYNDSYRPDNNGDLYGDGRLNTEINQFPKHFHSTTNSGIIQENDPRMAFFTANGKTYMTFEDGSDPNYVDMIIEVSEGVEVVEDAIEPEAEVYTMCFEDRPLIADYDLNDVVLRCTRKNETTLTLSLIACGGEDAVVIKGAEGWAYNNREVHDIFGIASAQGSNRFINTVVGADTFEPVTAEVTIEKGTLIPDYLKNIYIENQTSNKLVTIAKQGGAPCAIIVPQEFAYPRERVSILFAYPQFEKWAQDADTSKDWYLYPADDQTYK